MLEHRFTQNDITGSILDAVCQLNTAEVPHVNLLAPAEMKQLLLDADYVSLPTQQQLNNDATGFKPSQREEIVARQERKADDILGIAVGFKNTNTLYPGYNFNWFKQRFGDFLYIDRIIIAPQARGQKLGKHLYAQAQEWCLEHGLKRIVCEVNDEPANPVSHLFHQNMGFKKVESILHPEGKTVCMYCWDLEDAKIT